MCARRFLFAVAFLIVLAVAGAFALFQFGDRALTSLATPKGHYQAPPPNSGPDYTADAAWLAKPSLPNDPSRWVPDGVVSTRVESPAATFFIHPTTYLERDRWNAPIELARDAAGRTDLFVQSQASAFNGVSDVWAPRYRQAAFGAFLLRSEDATQALDLAYRDVLAAFDAFIAAQPSDKPIILAGHSQGSLHLSRLLVDRRETLTGRLVAAYVVGWPLSLKVDIPAMGLPACRIADEAKCVLSWQSFREPANTSMIIDAYEKPIGTNGARRERGDLMCTNPIGGTLDGGAPPSANLGTLVPNTDLSSATLVGGQVGAACKDGFLIIDGAIPALGPYVTTSNNYHVYDYALFWGSIRADAERRLKAYRP